MNIIETTRLRLHKVTPEIYYELFRTKSEEELRRFMGIHTPEEWAVELERQRSGMTGYRRSFLNFLIEEKESGKTIGSCGYHTWYLQHARAEIGYAIKDDQWKRKGYMTETLLPVIKYGFEVMNLNRVEAFIGANNIASQKLVKTLGFREEGNMRGHYNNNGKMEDSLIFGLLRNEFEH